MYDLIDNDAIKMDNLKYVVIDSSKRDSKEKSIWDLPECRASLFKLLGDSRLRATLDDVKFVLF